MQGAEFVPCKRNRGFMKGERERACVCVCVCDGLCVVHVTKRYCIRLLRSSHSQPLCSARQYPVFGVYCLRSGSAQPLDSAVPALPLCVDCAVALCYNVGPHAAQRGPQSKHQSRAPGASADHRPRVDQQCQPGGAGLHSEQAGHQAFQASDCGQPRGDCGQPRGSTSRETVFRPIDPAIGTPEAGI